ncbi:hypothetical protein CONPUDRAFT_162878 [Coniophora puteana RWD-64-598 SS2]|uniref:F-box domain-containing protein n=1 Tax=Coniophora puteana (strain RWD-64-598) TaxID=741705 RepID=A0A5M3N370_CONPW|nr:uncharacterized protein CONPUDRAFT_162878 [Coniophora puteana RWD-64-598 SS2]EIW85766.1 hypothetical protein CONPUDRAFT_162878 [Coniophora puteana RWD-64-598 SS2]
MGDSMSPTHSKMGNPSFRTPSILSLAPETMLEIFDFLLPDAKASLKRANSDPSTVFPFSPARVCRCWLNILSLKPSYWSSIVVPLHLPMIPPTLSTYVDVLARQNNIDECLIYSDAASPLPSSTECARIDAVLRALAPHFHKCRTISIRTQYRSSTLLASRHLNGLDTERLIYFSLVSSEADSTEEAHFTSFSCPKLHRLSMDGKTLLSFARSDGQKGPEKGRPYIHVTPYRPPSGPSHLTPSALIAALIKLVELSHFLEWLHVDNVAFDEAPEHYGMPPLDVCDVKFTDLDGLFLREFFRRFEGGEGRSVHTTRCTFDYPVEIREADSLCLERIDDGAAIMCALMHWDGLSLSMKNCRGFTDAALNMVTAEDWFLDLYDLEIKNCPVSVRAVRSFVEARNINTLQEVKVSGETPLGDEDRRWFEDNFQGSFSWTTERDVKSTL